MGCRKPRNGDTIGRAAHVVQSEFMAELHGTGIAAVFTADAELNARAGLPSSGNGLLHQRTDSLSIEDGEGIGLHNIGGSIEIDELGRIVAGETERRLSQVVRAE